MIRSSYIPTWLGIRLAAAGSGYLIDSFGSILLRNYSVEVAAFTGVGEAFFMVWLLARGRRISLRDESRPATN